MKRKRILRLKTIINKNHLEMFKVFSDFAGINYTVIDIEGNFVFKNASFAERFPHIHKASDLLDAWDNCKKVIKNGKRVLLQEEYDNKFYISVKQPLIRDKKCEGIMVLSLDITETKQAEIAKNQFIKSINHDIRNPLMGAISLTESLRKNETDEPKKSKMAMVCDCLHQLTKYLEQSLEVANGKKDYKKEDFSLYEIIEEVTDFLQPLVIMKDLTLIKNAPCTRIIGYKNEIKNILLNLITNAVKYTEKGSVTISAIIMDNEKLEISVEDTGIGIEEKHLKRIFENFYKVIPSELEPKFNGAGMGLYLVERIVNNMGGTISVSSKSGEGSKFTVTLPIEER